MLREVMSRANLTIWPEVAMVIFFAVFIFVVYRVMRHTSAEELRHMSRLPLDDERCEPSASKGEQA